MNISIDKGWIANCEARSERLRKATIGTFWEDFWLLCVVMALLGCARW